MNALAVIPCRMGSTRIPRKNLTPLPDGGTFLTWAVQAAMACDHVVASTDADWVDRIRDGMGHVHPHVAAVARPDALCEPTADIRDATKDAAQQACGMWARSWDWVVTIQPAVLLHSAAIVRLMLERLANCDGLRGALTFCRTHPFTWQLSGKTAVTWWFTEMYPRTQDLPEQLSEINGVQIARMEDVMAGKRWSAPLLAAVLPAWGIALDIDTADDNEAIQPLWPAMRDELLAPEITWRRIQSVVEGE